MNTEKIKEAALEFAHKQLAFTDDMVSYDKGQYAGFMEGAEWALKELQQEQSSQSEKTLTEHWGIKKEQPSGEQLREEKPAVKPILFKTSDGVNIHEGDTYWYTNDLIIHKRESASDFGFKKKAGDEAFSSLELAQEYVILNTPCLSIKDIRHEHYEDLTNPQTKSLTELEHLVQSRIKHKL